MKLQELIDELTDLAPEVGPGTEVRLAIQPHYPFQHSIADVVVASTSTEQVTCPECDGKGQIHLSATPDHDEADYECARCDGYGGIDDPDGEPVVFIAEGGQLYDEPYLPGPARDELGWR
jgi:predicted RNA-binding Zn-ribbon protein involved in translation (DUF1610 family)